MINLETNELNGKPIVRWEVWWRTFLGLHRELEEAQMAAASSELPMYMIKAVPVALDAAGNYEERV